MLTTEIACRMCPEAPRGNVEEHLPAVIAALERFGISDHAMQLMAVATIRVETGAFVPLSEFVSRWNTQPWNVTNKRPVAGAELFGQYGPGTRIGRSLGNTQPGDGARFKGRGFVQLTGRSNYERIGRVIGQDLVANPESANDPYTAALILAAFLKDHEMPIRQALARGDLASARKFVNGGTLGLDKFAEAYKLGAMLLA